jgi:hypothetical protein
MSRMDYLYTQSPRVCGKLASCKHDYVPTDAQKRLQNLQVWRVASKQFEHYSNGNQIPFEISQNVFCTHLDTQCSLEYS